MQTPKVAPCALVQIPPQHSALFEHASPFWVQNEPGEQAPLLQTLEQHSACAEHELPSVWHTGFSGAQTPLPLQVPLQHCAADVHD